MSGYPLAHKIDTRHPYTSADKTDIRKTFAKARNAQVSRYPVLDADLIPAGTAQREKPDFSGF